MAGEYNIIFDDGDHRYSELVNDFVTRLNKEAEKWGFTSIENNPGMSYFDQLDDMKKTSKVTIVILLPNHDDRRAIIKHQAQTTLLNAIEQTVPMIPICLENANPTHFKMYNKIEFKTTEDWGHSDSWTKLLKALRQLCDKNQGEGLGETNTATDSPPVSPRHDFISDKYIGELANKIVAEWWKLAIRLGLCSNKVEEIERNNHRDVCGMAREMLFCWRSSSDLETDNNEQQQISRLCQGLRMIGKTMLAENVESKCNGHKQLLPPLKMIPVDMEKSISNEVFLLELAAKLPNWEEYGLLLGIKEGVLQTFKNDFPNDTHRKSFQTLVRWRDASDQSDDDKMTKLIQMLKDQRRNDVVEWIKGSTSANTCSDVTRGELLYTRSEHNQSDEFRQLSSDKTTLDEACSKHGRTSPEIKAECKRICEGFKRNGGVKDAWPAYVYPKGDTESEERITFIVITESNDINLDDQGYRCVLRQNDTISDACKAENADISKAEMEAMKNTEQKDDSSDCFDGIMLKIEDETDELMSKHKNINRITASRVKSTGYRCGKESIKEQICIALYVHVKGFIPLDENHFPDRIGDYPVDIREGIVSLGLSCHGKK